MHIPFSFSCAVSIPRRYAKNTYGDIDLSTFDLFQFLVGTLKTRLRGANNFPKQMFQFLVGTLKTAAGRVRVYPVAEFQFLVGTLKTDYVVGH